MAVRQERIIKDLKQVDGIERKNELIKELEILHENKIKEIGNKKFDEIWSENEEYPVRMKYKL